MSKSDRRARERDLAERVARSAETGLKKDLMELLELRYIRRSEDLIATGSELIRGKAQEADDLRKVLGKRIDNTIDAP